MIKNILIITIFIFPLMLPAQSNLKLTWEDLKPVYNYIDPFKELTESQLYNLSSVAGYRQLEEENQILKDYSINRKDSLEKTLTKEGVDIDYLLSMREKVKQERMKEANSTNFEYNGKNVSISGYLLALNYVDEHSTEFLLVPWVGACIHTPPPPRNQIVYLNFEKGYKVNSRYEAVTVEGLMTIEEKESELYLVDGASQIGTGYSLKATAVDVYK